MQIFEVKFEVDIHSEDRIIEILGLKLEKKYEDSDTYFKDQYKPTLKYKALDDGRIIFYKVQYDGQCFDIQGEVISEHKKQELLQNYVSEITLHRKKHKYLWPKYKVNISFDYIAELPNRLFIEIHCNDRSLVLEAAQEVKELLNLGDRKTVPYSILVKNSN